MYFSISYQIENGEATIKSMYCHLYGKRIHFEAFTCRLDSTWYKIQNREATMRLCGETQEEQELC